MQQPLDPVELAKLTLKDAVLDVIEFRGETTIVVKPETIVDVMRFFRDTEGLEYIFLSDITAVDYFPQEPRFALNYHLLSMLYLRRLRVKVYLHSDDPRIESVTSVFASADWEEREAYDMMGIHFENHPSLRRVLMPEDWEGHPQRKDYPLGYEQVQFSFNFDDIERLKPYAKE